MFDLCQYRSFSNSAFLAVLHLSDRNIPPASGTIEASCLECTVARKKCISDRKIVVLRFRRKRIHNRCLKRRDDLFAAINAFMLFHVNIYRSRDKLVLHRVDSHGSYTSVDSAQSLKPPFCNSVTGNARNRVVFYNRRTVGTFILSNRIHSKTPAYAFRLLSAPSCPP